MTAPASHPCRSSRPALLLLPVLAALVLGAGCGSDKHVAPVVKGPVLPPGTPSATAPDSATLRWFTAYAAGVEDAADTLLSADFHYHFSDQTDPVLVSAYGFGWDKAKEVTSLHHLIHGFTNDMGTSMAAATAMVFSAIPPTVLPDTSHADSSAWYKRVFVARLSLTIDVPDAYGGLTYNIQSPLELLLVRGDAAVLGPGQPPVATRWYVRECDDETTLYGYAGWKGARTDMPLPSSATSWGKIRAAYLR